MRLGVGVGVGVRVRRAHLAHSRDDHGEHHEVTSAGAEHAWSGLGLGRVRVRVRVRLPPPEQSMPAMPN